MAKLIGADWLVYQNLHDLVASSAEGNPNIERFDCSVFDGQYVTGDVDVAYLAKLEAARNDEVKSQNEEDDGAGIDLHNDDAA